MGDFGGILVRDRAHAVELFRRLVDRSPAFRAEVRVALPTGAKWCENRTWSTTYRGPLVVHASKTWDPVGYELARHLGVPAPTKRDCPTGYVAAGDLFDVHHADFCSNWCEPWDEPGVYHWALDHAKAFEQPIDGPGRLRLYTPPRVVMEVPW